MSAPCRDGSQQNAAAFKRDTAAEIASETDFMLKIMTATPASTEAMTTTTTTTTSTSTLSTVNAQNKCATAAPTTFSYQRAAKRCARLKQTTREPTETETATAKAKAKATEKATSASAATNTAHTFTVTTNSALETAATISKETTTEVVREICERQRRLAERKAQVRAAFFKDFNVLAAQQKSQPQLREEQAKAFDTNSKRIHQLIEKFQAMIVQQPTEQLSSSAGVQQQQLLKPTMGGSSAANSDEGCNAGGLSPCSSDNEGDSAAVARRLKPKVTRCASSDSALGLEVDDVNMDVMPPPSPQRRMTLTVTDLPLRPALLPLAEPTALPDSPLTSPTNPTAAVVGSVGVSGVPSKVLLEERVVAALSAPPSSRRESTQSCISELGSAGGVRYVRTPSVVVSDYSDDITACGISMEEMEYFRLQRARCQRRCSLEASAAAAGSIGSAKDEAQSDVSAASSCSNLYYCGSTISALDGGECIVNGVRVALARKSSHSSSGDLSGGDDDDVDVDVDVDVGDDDEDEELELAAEVQVEVELVQQRERELERERERERQLSELLAATQLGDGLKKVGSSCSSSSSSSGVKSSTSNDSVNAGSDSKSQI